MVTPLYQLWCLRLRTAALVAVAVLVVALGLIAPATAAGVCPNWVDTHDVFLTSGTVTWLYSPSYSCTYTNLNITVYCEPQSTLIISHLTLNGGYITIVGPANATTSGNLTDVSIQVYDSTITADLGPAVGVIIGHGANITTPVAANTTGVNGTNSSSSSSTGGSSSSGSQTLIPYAAQNVSLYAVRSTLTSSSDGAAVALGFTLDEAVITYPTLMTNIAIEATQSTLSATAVGNNTAASAAGLAWGFRFVVFSSLDIDTMNITLVGSTATATVDCRSGEVYSSATAAAGGIALPSLAGSLSLNNFIIAAVSSTLTSLASSTEMCSVSAIAASAAVAAGQVLGGAVTFSNANVSAVSSTVSSSAIVAPNMTEGNQVAASVGFATTYLTAPSSFTDINFFAVLSNTTSNASYTFAHWAHEDGSIAVQSAATSAGISISQTDYFVTFTRVALAVLWGTASSDAFLMSESIHTSVAASVAGTAMANVRVGVLIESCFFYAASSTAFANAAAVGGPARAASAIAAHVEAGQISFGPALALFASDAVTLITSSRFLVAGGIAYANSTVLITRWNISYTRAFAGVGSIVAYLQPMAMSVQVGISHATACAYAAATYKGGRSRVFGDAVVGRVENVYNYPNPQVLLSECVTHSKVTTRKYPACLCPWLCGLRGTPSRSRSVTFAKSATRSYSHSHNTSSRALTVSASASRTHSQSITYTQTATFSTSPSVSASLSFSVGHTRSAMLSRSSTTTVSVSVTRHTRTRSALTAPQSATNTFSSGRTNSESPTQSPTDTVSLSKLSAPPSSSDSITAGHTRSERPTPSSTPSVSGSATTAPRTSSATGSPAHTRTFSLTASRRLPTRSISRSLMTGAHTSTVSPSVEPTRSASSTDTHTRTKRRIHTRSVSLSPLTLPRSASSSFTAGHTRSGSVSVSMTLTLTRRLRTHTVSRSGLSAAQTSSVSASSKHTPSETNTVSKTATRSRRRHKSFTPIPTPTRLDNTFSASATQSVSQSASNLQTASRKASVTLSTTLTLSHLVTATQLLTRSVSPVATASKGGDNASWTRLHSPSRNETSGTPTVSRRRGHGASRSATLFTESRTENATGTAALAFSASANASASSSRSANVTESRSAEDMTPSAAQRHGSVSSNITSTTSMSYSLTLTVNDTATMSKEPRRRTPGHGTETPTIVVVNVPVLPPGILTREAEQTNQVVVATVATGATALASPAAAFQASRALSVIALSQCKFDYDGPIDFPLSTWPGFAIDVPHRGAYLRGGVVAAIGTVGAFAVLGAVVVVCIKVFKRTAFMPAASVISYPGVVTIPVGITLDGMVTCAVAALIHGESRVADIGLAIVAMVYLGCVTAGAVITGYRMPPTSSEYKDHPTNGRIDAFVRGQQGWFARLQRDPSDLPAFRASPRALFRSFGSVFKKYTAGRRWFYIADIWLTVCVSVTKGTMPTTLQGCFVATGIIMSLCCVMAILVVVTRPYVSPAKNALLVVSSALTFFAAALVFAAMARDDSTLLKTGQTLALLAGYVSIGNLAVALIGEVTKRGLKGKHRAQDIDSDAEPDDINDAESTTAAPLNPPVEEVATRRPTASSPPKIRRRDALSASFARNRQGEEEALQLANVRPRNPSGEEDSFFEMQEIATAERPLGNSTFMVSPLTPLPPRPALVSETTPLPSPLMNSTYSQPPTALMNLQGDEPGDMDLLQEAMRILGPPPPVPLQGEASLYTAPTAPIAHRDTYVPVDEDAFAML